MTLAEIAATCDVEPKVIIQAVFDAPLEGFGDIELHSPPACQTVGQLLAHLSTPKD